MKVAKYLIFISVLFCVVAVFLIYSINKKSLSGGQRINDTNFTDCTPSFRDGGGPYYLPNSPFRTKIAPTENNGEKLTVSGVVLKNDCKTLVQGAVIDIWQANESGNYEDEWYRGRVTTDSSGKYLFETVIPKGYGEGTGYRPPHIHFKVFVQEKEIVTSQMFFPESKGTPGFNDDYIIDTQVSEEEGKKFIKGIYNIILP